MEMSTGREKEYSRQKIQLSILRTVLTFVFLIVILITGLSVFVRNRVVSWSSNFYIGAVLYLIIFRIVYDLVFLALDFYSGFIVEHKFSLSNQTFFDWIKQSLKKWVLSFVLFICCLAPIWLSNNTTSLTCQKKP